MSTEAKNEVKADKLAVKKLAAEIVEYYTNNLEKALKGAGFDGNYGEEIAAWVREKNYRPPKDEYPSLINTIQRKRDQNLIHLPLETSSNVKGDFDKGARRLIACVPLFQKLAENSDIGTLTKEETELAIWIPSFYKAFKEPLDAHLKQFPTGAALVGKAGGNPGVSHPATASEDTKPPATTPSPATPQQ